MGGRGFPTVRSRRVATPNEDIEDLVRSTVNC
jgi:hypothetical protein